MLALKFETNRERRVSPTPTTPPVVLYHPALGYCYLRSNHDTVVHDTIVCSNAFYPSYEVDIQYLRIEAMLSRLDCLHPLRTVCSPFQHDQCVGIDFLMPDGAASLSTQPSRLHTFVNIKPTGSSNIHPNIEANNKSLSRNKRQAGLINHILTYQSLPVGSHDYSVKPPISSSEQTSRTGPRHHQQHFHRIKSWRDVCQAWPMNTFFFCIP